MIQIPVSPFPSLLKPILIAGCSVRAAVWSAREAGIPCIAADQFGDVDLRDRCEQWWLLSRDYRELPQYLRDLDISAWCYTGGLENHPDILLRGAECARLLGVPGEAVRRLREPQVLRANVNAAQFPMPETRAVSTLIPAGDWLAKPYRSGGGLGVRFAGSTDQLEGDFYWQRHVPGIPYSVSFLACETSAQILGAVRQFVATSNEILMPDSIRHSDPFLYCGGVTASLDELGDIDRLQSLLDQLTVTFNLVGLCGIDLIKSASGEVHVLEINPRYTASMELLERQQQRSFLPLHVAACLRDHKLIQEIRQENTTATGASPLPYVAKQILYTPTGLTVPENGITMALGGCFLDQVNPDVLLADQPLPGSLLPAGSPICTLIAFGHTEAECLGTLRYYAGRLAIVLDQEKWSMYHRNE